MVGGFWGGRVGDSHHTGTEGTMQSKPVSAEVPARHTKQSEFRLYVPRFQISNIFVRLAEL